MAVKRHSVLGRFGGGCVEVRMLSFGVVVLVNRGLSESRC